MKVVIIGAGAAGLAAASTLEKSGLDDLDLTILEASDRIGGRILSHDLQGDYVELGAQWVHGEVGNVACEIATKLGILDDPKEETLEDIGEDFYEENGEEWSEEVAERCEEVIEDALDDLDEKDIPANESFEDYFTRRVKEAVGTGDKEFERKMKLMEDFYHREQQVSFI